MRLPNLTTLPHPDDKILTRDATYVVLGRYLTRPGTMQVRDTETGERSDKVVLGLWERERGATSPQVFLV